MLASQYPYTFISSKLPSLSPPLSHCESLPPTPTLPSYFPLLSLCLLTPPSLPSSLSTCLSLNLTSQNTYSNKYGPNGSICCPSFVDVIGSCRLVLLFIPMMNAGRRHHNFFFAGLWVINVLSYINATFNFVVYYTMGSRYRQTFWALFGRKSKSKETSGLVTSLSTAS